MGSPRRRAKAGTKIDQPLLMSNVNAAASLVESSSRGPSYTSYPPVTEFGPVSSEELPVECGIVLDDDDRVRRAAIGKLMCDDEVDLDRIEDECYEARPMMGFESD